MNVYIIMNAYMTAYVDDGMVNDVGEDITSIFINSPTSGHF